MSRLDFEHLDDSTPYDRSQVLTRWRLVGGVGYPTAENTPHGPARRFIGNTGYEADDLGAMHMGLRSLTVRALVQLDFDALDGQTATVLCRGQGGPTAGLFWAWDVRVSVADYTATLALGWQHTDGDEVIHTLGTIERTANAAWHFLSVTRETTPAGSHMRLVVDDKTHGELVSNAPIPATPGARITIGCRRNGSAFDQMFHGVIAWVELLDTAVTPLQERHIYRERLLWPEQCGDDVRGYWFQSSIPMRDSLYECYRLRPLAALQSSVIAAIERRAEAGLPNTAYGQRLIDWERALRLTDNGDLTVAQRQQRAADAVALVEGVNVPALRAYAARVFGINESDLALIEATNRVGAKLSDTTSTNIAGVIREALRAWRIYGNIETRHDATGAYLSVRPADLSKSLRYRNPQPADNITGAGFCEVAIPRDARISVTLGRASSSASQADTYVGLMLRIGVYVQCVTISEGAHLMVITADGVSDPVQEDLGALPTGSSNIWDIALSNDAQGVRIRVRNLSEGLNAWVEYRPTVAALPGPPTWFGFGTAATTDTPVDVAMHVYTVRIDYPTSPARRWTVIADVPRDLSVIELLERKNRASAQAGWSRDDEARADSEKTFVGYTPTIRC